MLCLKELRDRWLDLAEATRQKRKDVSAVAAARAEEVHKIIFTGNDLRLVLSKRDKDFFHDLVTGVTTKEPKRGADQSHRRLWEATETLRSELFDPLLTTASLNTRSGRSAYRRSRTPSWRRLHRPSQYR